MPYREHAHGRCLAVVAGRPYRWWLPQRRTGGRGVPDSYAGRRQQQAMPHCFRALPRIRLQFKYEEQADRNVGVSTVKYQSEGHVRDSREFCWNTVGGALRASVISLDESLMHVWQLLVSLVFMLSPRRLPCANPGKASCPRNEIPCCCRLSRDGAVRGRTGMVATTHRPSLIQRGAPY